MKLSDRYGLRERIQRSLGGLIIRDKLYRRLLEHVSEAVGAFDADENAIYVNPAFAKLTGYKQEKCMKMNCLDFFDEGNKKIILSESAKRKFHIASRYEAVLTTKSGEKVPVLISGSPLGDGGSIGVIADLRETRGREAKLKKYGTYEKILSAILENSADAIISLDLGKNVLSWNKAATALLGYNEKEMLSRSIESILPEKLLEEGEIERMRAETSKWGGLRNFQTIRKHKNGQLIPVSISQSHLLDEKDQLFGYSVIYRDISAQQHWEKELRQQFEKIQDAYQEMGRQRRYLDYFEELVDVAREKQRIEDITLYIVNAFLMIGHVDAVTLRLYEEKTKRLKLEAATGVSKDWWSKKYIPLEGSIFEKAWQERKMQKIMDIWCEPGYQAPGLARKHNLKSVLAIPLFSGNDLYGGISLYITPNTPISVFDNEFIWIFAKLVTLVLNLRKRQ